jgi:hypothetical protein
LVRALQNQRKDYFTTDRRRAESAACDWKDLRDDYESFTDSNVMEVIHPQLPILDQLRSILGLKQNVENLQWPIVRYPTYRCRISLLTNSRLWIGITEGQQ